MENFNHLTTSQKVFIVQGSDELQAAMNMLVGLFKECNLKSYIRLTYKIADSEEEFEITLLRTKESGDNSAAKEDEYIDINRVVFMNTNFYGKRVLYNNMEWDITGVDEDCFSLSATGQATIPHVHFSQCKIINR